MSIAVFDSGVGGISVLKSLVEVMPNEDFIYYGDSANAPYGTKTLEQVRALTCEHAKELILNQHAKGLVVACNTATSAAVRILREQYPDVPIVGIEPAVKPAMLFMENPRVLVMATPMTIREEKLKKLMDRYRHLGEIIPLPCPGLMNFVERGDLYGDDVRQYLEELLYSYSHGEIDAVVLGCTHYPFVRKMIQEVLGDRVRVFDGGNGTAREMKRRLAEKGLLTDSTAAGIVDFQNSLRHPDRHQHLEHCHGCFRCGARGCQSGVRRYHLGCQHRHQLRYYRHGEPPDGDGAGAAVRPVVPVALYRHYHVGALHLYLYRDLWPYD